MGLFHRIAAAALAATLATTARAQDALPELPVIGAPVPGETSFQPAVTSVARDLQWLDGLVLVIITVITIFVLALLGWCIVAFRASRNKEPARFTHNTPIEVAWTVVPIVILVFIGSFSLPVLFNQQEIPEPEVLVKATGYQWYWGYEYPDEGIEFESFMIGAPATGGSNMLDEATSQALADAGYADEHFLLATDTAVVIPTGRTVVVQVTGADVIHAWTIPAFGVKQDAVPGRLAELWFEVDEGMEGTYFGQCSELCGIAHAYMPITVKAVTQEEYDVWLGQQKLAQGIVDETLQVASAD